MSAFRWGQTALPAVQQVMLPAVQKMQDFHFREVAQDVHRTGITLQDFHFIKAETKASHRSAETPQGVDFEAIAQDFHKVMGATEAPELALKAVMVDCPDL